MLVLLLGCGPSAGVGEDGGADTSTGGTTHASSSGDGVSTTGARPTTATSSSADTTPDTGDGSPIFDVGGVDETTGDPCDPRERCPLPGDAFAQVRGSTPLGEFTGAFAWSGLYSGECGGTGIAITPTLEGFEMDVVCTTSFDPPDPSLYLFIGDVFYEGDCTIDGLLRLTHTLDGTTAETTPQVELTLCEELDDEGAGRIEGSFTATRDGWNLTGTFIAPRCIDLDIACP